VEHLVRYRTPTGDDRFEPHPSLEAAIARVERLRNDEGAPDTRLYREVPLEVKAYYRVSLAGEQDAPAAGGASPPPLTAVPSPAAATAPPAPPAVSAPSAPSAVSSTPPPGAMPIPPPMPAAAESTEEPGPAPEEPSGRTGLFRRG